MGPGLLPTQSVPAAPPSEKGPLFRAGHAPFTLGILLSSGRSPFALAETGAPLSWLGLFVPPSGRLAGLMPASACELPPALGSSVAAGFGLQPTGAGGPPAG